MAKNSEAKVTFRAFNKDFNKAISEMSAESKKLRQEMKLQQEQMKHTATDSEKLKATIGNLEKQYAVAQKATAETAQQLEKVKTQFGANSNEAAKLETQLRRNQIAEQQIANRIKETAESLKVAKEAERQRASETAKAAQKLDELRAKEEQLQSSIGKLNADYELQKAKLGDSASESEKLAQKIDHLNQLHRLAGENVKNYEQQLEEAKKQYGDNSAEVDKYETQLLEARTAEQQLANEIESTNRALTEQGDALKQTSDKFEQTGEKMTGIGKNMTMKVTAPIVGLGTAAVMVGANFEEGMSKVAAVSGATGENFEKLRNQAKQLGAETKFSATEAAFGMEKLALAGWKTNEILSAMPGMLDLAAAGGLDLAQAADITSDTMQAFGMSAERAGHAADVFAHAQANANTNVSMMGEAMKYLAPVANSLGWELEESAAAVMKLADSGIKGSMAGQAFASSLSRLAKPELQKKIKALRIEFFDMQGNLKPLPEVVGEVEKATRGMTNEQKAAALTTLFGAEAYKHWAILLESGSEVLQQTTEDLINADGAAKKMADTMNDNTKGKIKELLSALESLAIELSEILLPVVNVVVKIFTVLARVFASIPKPIQAIIIALAGILAAIGPILVVLGTLISSFGTVMGVLSKAPQVLGFVSMAVRGLGSALMFLVANPVGLAITAIGILTIALTKLFKYLRKGSSDSASDFGSEIEKSANEASSSLKDFESDAKDTFDVVSDESQIAGESIGENIATGVGKGAKKAKDDAIKNMREMADKMKQEIDRGTEKINKLGDAIVQSLRKQYDEMEKAQTKAIDKKVETEKKASDEIIKQYEKELNERTKMLDKQLEAEKKASDERLKIYDKEQTEKLKLIDEEAYLKVKALQDEIDAIDKKTETEDKAEKKREHQIRVSELKKQIALAETAEERERLGKDLNKTIADYERQQLLEQRKQQKDSLQEQIEAVKEATNEKKEQLKQEVADKKEAEKEKLEAVQNAIKDEKEATKEKYSVLKEQEQERTKTVQDSLNREKEAVKAHFDTLKNEENLRLEARKLIVDQNNKEILRLLKSYNSHWQDAGQSLADSLINGLNSEKQSIENAIEEAVNLEPIIKGKIAELDKLEQRIKRLEKENGLDTETGSTGNSSLGSLGGDVVSSTGQIKELEQATVNLDEKLAGATTTAKEFGEEIKVTTNEAVNSFLNLNNNVSSTFKEISWSGKTVTTELASNVTANFDEMKNQVVSKLQEQKEQSEQKMREMLETSTAISEEEKSRLIEIARSGYDEQIVAIEKGHARVAEIWQKASEEKRALTEEEKLEINQIQQDMVNKGVEILSSSEEEHKVILKRMKAEHGRIAAEQAAAIVKRSLEQKEKTISTAKAEYVERIKVADKLRAQGTKAASLAADEIIKEANRQRDQTIRNAEEMHINVVKEAKLQAKEHVDQVNWETGEVLSHWERHRLNVAKKTQEIKEAVSNIWNSMWSEIKQIAGNISDKFEQIGKDTTDGLIKGIGSKASAVRDKAKIIAGGIGTSIKEELKIASPSKLTFRFGENTGEGLEGGLVAKIKAVASAGRRLATAAAETIQEKLIPARSATDGFTVSPAQAVASTQTSTIVNHYYERMMDGANFVIREEADVQKIAREFLVLQQRNERGGGR